MFDKIPFDVNTVEAAAHDDEKAINVILNYYEPYINNLARHQIWDRKKEKYISIINEDIKIQLQYQLIKAIKKFKKLN